MKTVAISRQPKPHYPAFPNAAERGYFLHQLLDGALVVAITAGTLITLIFLLLL